MWYVIQTITGKEEELIIMIKTVLDKELYTDCFAIKAEWMKRLSGEWRVQVRPLFPGYIFIESERPEDVFQKLKNIPKFSRILGNEKFEFVPVNKCEHDFLELISGGGEKEDRIVRLTEVVTGNTGKILSLNGVLQFLKKNIIEINYHKRYALVKTELFNKSQTLIFGIRLRHDSFWMN